MSERMVQAMLLESYEAEMACRQVEENQDVRDVQFEYS